MSSLIHVFLELSDSSSSSPASSFGGCGALQTDGGRYFELLVFLHFLGCGALRRRVVTISKNKEGNLVPPCRSLSSSLLLAGAKNTINIVVSGDNSGSKVKRENGDVAFWPKKGQKTQQK